MPSARRSKLEARNAVNKYAAIWVKGNAGEDLDRVEKIIYMNLLKNKYSQIFWHTFSREQLGSSLRVDPHDFAAFLHDNPGARAAWLAWQQEEKATREYLIGIPVGREYADVVLADLEKLAKRDATP